MRRLSLCLSSLALCVARSITEVCTSAKWYLGQAHKLTIEQQIAADSTRQSPPHTYSDPCLVPNLVTLAIFMANMTAKNKERKERGRRQRERERKGKHCSIFVSIELFISITLIFQRHLYIYSGQAELLGRPPLFLMRHALRNGCN